MDSLLSSSVDSSVKTHGLAGLLSSLDSTSGGSASTGAFAKFLQQKDDAAPAPSQPSSSPVTQTAGAQSADNTAPANGNSSLRFLKKMVVGLRHILTRLNQYAETKAPRDNQVNKGQSNAKGQASDAAQTQTPSLIKAQTQTQTTSHTTTDTSAADADSSVTAASDDPATSDGKTLAQVLSELVLLLQMIEKRLEMAQGSSAPADPSQAQATDPTQPSDPSQAKATDPKGMDALLDQLLAQTSATIEAQASTDNSTGTDVSTNTDNTSADADPLQQLMAFIQAIEKKLAPDETSPAQDPAITAAVQTSTPTVANDLFSISKDLKQILVALKNATANNNAAPQVSTSDADTTSQSTGTDSPAFNVSAFLKTIDPTQLSKTQTPAQASNLANISAGNADAAGNNQNPANNFAAIAANGLLSDGSSNGQGSSTDLTKDDGTSSGNAANALKTDTSIIPDSVAPTTPYNFASQLSDMRAINGGTTGLPPLVEQVILQLNRGVKDGNEEITIQLHPADLGKINIRLDISADNKVQGTVVADNPATLNSLLKDVRSLERALQEAGLRADPGSLQFSLGGHGNTSGQTANDSGSGGSNTKTSFNAADASVGVSADAGETWVLTPGRVNFKV